MILEFKRAVEKDCDLLFNWVNDIDVRKNSFNNDKISYENHIKWFGNKMKSDKSYIFILYLDKIPVGQVRIDIERGVGIISYSIDKDYRGKGLAVIMLRCLEMEIKNSKNLIGELVGLVKCNNIASEKIFEELKYKKTVQNDFYEYRKILE